MLDLSHVQAKLKDEGIQSPSMGPLLQEAAWEGHLEIMQLLLSNGAQIDDTVIAKARTIEVFQLLMEHGLQVNQPLPSGLMPLMLVVGKNDDQILRWFLGQGADPNLGPTATKGSPGSDDLHIPQSGAALEIAVLNKNISSFDILLDHGAKMENALVLHTVCIDRDGLIPMMEHLVRRGADVNKFGYHYFLDHGGTPLLMAAKTGDAEKARWLVEHGADPLIPDASHLYPIQWAEVTDEENGLCTPLFSEWHQRALDRAISPTRDRVREDHARVGYRRFL